MERKPDGKRKQERSRFSTNLRLMSLLWHSCLPHTSSTSGRVVYYFMSLCEPIFCEWYLWLWMYKVVGIGNPKSLPINQVVFSICVQPQRGSICIESFERYLRTLHSLFTNKQTWNTHRRVDSNRVVVNFAYISWKVNLKVSFYQSGRLGWYGGSDGIGCFIPVDSLK